jgi:hypothetical protein
LGEEVERGELWEAKKFFKLERKREKEVRAKES